MRVLPYGDRAVLAEVTDTDQAMSLYADIIARPPTGMLDCVPAARTVLITLAHRDFIAAVAADLAARRPSVLGRTDGDLIEIEATYDGEDLAEVATSTGLGVAEVIAAYRASRFVVGFCGFAPGFAYLTGLDPRLYVPRRTTPRTRVPAGAVAIAGEYAAVYPRESPGGWQLIGHTSHPVWDIGRAPPALLAPGTRVRFS